MSGWRLVFVRAIPGVIEDSLQEVPHFMIGTPLGAPETIAAR